MSRRRLAHRIDLYYPPTESAAADVVQAAIERSVPIIRETWGLEAPPSCRVYVMTGWLSFLLRSVPLHRLLSYAIAVYYWPFYPVMFPFFVRRMRRSWRVSAGWTFPYRHRPTVGVKSPRPANASDPGIGAQVFTPPRDRRTKVEHVTCHELTHAFAAHLKLPLWLSEGIAMVAVDRYFGHSTVRSDSLRLLQASHTDAHPAAHRQLPRMSHQEAARQYVRGYWLTRLIEEKQPGLVKELLAQSHSRQAMETQVAAAIDVPRESLWQTVDGLLVARFSGSETATT